MLLAPLPLRPQNRRKVGHLEIPAEDSLRLRRIRNQFRRVALSPCFDSNRYRTSGNFASTFDNFQNGIPMPGSEIDEVGITAQPKIIQRKDVSFAAKVAYMHIIPDSRSVGGGVVSSKNREFRLFSYCRASTDRTPM